MSQPLKNQKSTPPGEQALNASPSQTIDRCQEPDGVIRRFWKQYPLTDSTLLLYRMLTAPKQKDKPDTALPLETAVVNRFVKDLEAALAAFSKVTRRPRPQVTLLTRPNPIYHADD